MRPLVALGAAILGLSATPVAGMALGGSLMSPNLNLLGPRHETRQVASPPACVNGPTTRNCWLPGFDANTNNYQLWPNTGRTVTVSTRLKSIKFN